MTKGKKVINYKLNDLVLCYGGAQDAHVINQNSIVLKIRQQEETPPLRILEVDSRQLD
jgi:hypothetical protein